MTDEIALNIDDLRAVAAYAVASAADVLNLVEHHHPADSRPRDAIDAARAFAGGGPRNKALRDTAWAALKAAQSADNAAAAEAARAAMTAASAAYLHTPGPRHPGPPHPRRQRPRSPRHRTGRCRNFNQDASKRKSLRIHG